MRRQLVFIPLLVSLLLAGGCVAPTPAPRSPALPGGTERAPVPEVEVSALLYFHQGTPLTLEAEAPGRSLVLRVDSLTLWTSPTGLALGGLARFTGVEQMRLLATLLGALPDTWVRGDGPRLFFLSGKDPWVQRAREALTERRTGPFPQRYAEEWRLLQGFPSSPPDRPVAAGFVRPTPEAVRALGSLLPIDTAGLMALLESAKAQRLALVLYSERPLRLRASPAGMAFPLEEVSGLLAVETGLPGLLVGAAFPALAEQAGLTRVSLPGGHTAYEVPGLPAPFTGLLRPKGNVLHLALAPSRQKAEALLLSLLQ